MVMITAQVLQANRVVANAIPDVGCEIDLGPFWGKAIVKELYHNAWDNIIELHWPNHPQGWDTCQFAFSVDKYLVN